MTNVDEQPYVSVRGEAHLEVEAEQARLVLTVAARDKQRDRAVELLAARTDEVLRAVKGFGEAVEAVETTSVRVYPSYRDGHGRERIEGYVAQLTHTVTVVDFTILGDLISGVSAATTEVSGPWWALRRDSDHYRAARVAAVEDARVRAGQYAAALGSRLTGLVHLADAGLLASAPTPTAFAMTAGMQRMAGTGDEPQLSLEPQRQVVLATVEARFTMSPPDLSS